MKKLKIIATLSMAAALAACGGGGDDEPSTNASVEGFWSNADSAILVTNTGELWGVEGSGSTLSLYKGSVTTNGSNFSAPLSVYVGNQKVAATASGTVKEQQTLQGSVSAAGQTSSFTLTYDATYNQAAPSLATLAGTYKDDNSATFTVTSDGKFSGAVSGCTESGSITPDASGKNFYRMTLTVGQESACGFLAGQTGQGVLAPFGAKQLIGGVVLGNLGDAVVLTKQ